MTTPTILAAALALALTCGIAFAQNPATPATPATPAAAPAAAPAAPTAPLPTIAAHKCEKPEFPGKVAPETRIRKWSADFRG